MLCFTKQQILTQDLSGWNVCYFTSKPNLFDSGAISWVLPKPKFGAICSENPFISVWNTSKTTIGSSNNKQIKLPLTSQGDYNFSVDWGDGTIERISTWNSSSATHTYSQGGVKTITISGKIKGFRFNNEGDREKLINITNWGSLNLGNEGGYFYGAENLESILGQVNLEGTTNFSGMFQGASKFNGYIENWDVSLVTDMSHMFFNASQFNRDLSGWNVCNVVWFENFDNGTISWTKPRLGWACVVNVTSSNLDGHYGIGEKINLTVVFNRNVSVEGTPLLRLNVSGSGKDILLHSSSKNTLLFVYVVEEGDNSFDLNYMGENALFLNGSSVNSTNGKPSILTLLVGVNSFGGNRDIVIDTKKPEITVSPITGEETKMVSADDDEMNTTMSYRIQSSNNCDLEIPSDVLNYIEGHVIDLDKEEYNRKYVCFWSKDLAGNIGTEASEKITGVVEFPYGFP